MSWSPRKSTTSRQSRKFPTLQLSQKTSYFPPRFDLLPPLQLSIFPQPSVFLPCFTALRALCCTIVWTTFVDHFGPQKLKLLMCPTFGAPGTSGARQKSPYKLIFFNSRPLRPPPPPPPPLCHPLIFFLLWLCPGSAPGGLPAQAGETGGPGALREESTI